MKPGVWLALAMLLVAPPALAKPGASDVPAAAVLASIPMLPSQQRSRVIVDLAPQGQRPFRLMLDTGAETSVLTPRYARKSGVIVRRVQDRPYEHSTLLGRDLQFEVDTESSDTASRTGFEYGLLGGNFLGHYVLDLDFASRRVSFLDPERFAVPESVSAPDEAVLPLRVVGNRPFTWIEVDGKRVRVLLDTGMPLPMALSGRSVHRAGLPAPTPLVKVDLAGVLGPIASTLIEARSLAIGPFHFSPAPAVFAPEGVYNQGGATGSLVGYEILEAFHVRIDYRHRRLWLKRIPGRPLTCFGVPWKAARRAGIIAMAGDGGLRVSAVVPDSPAAGLGLRPGDWIALHGDGSPMQQITSAIDRIQQGGPITVIRTVNRVRVETRLGDGSPGPRSH